MPAFFAATFVVTAPSAAAFFVVDFVAAFLAGDAAFLVAVFLVVVGGTWTSIPCSFSV